MTSAEELHLTSISFSVAFFLEKNAINTLMQQVGWVLVRYGVQTKSYGSKRKQQSVLLRERLKNRVFLNTSLIVFLMPP